MKFLLCLAWCAFLQAGEDKSFVVVIPSYNNEMWSAVNLRSILNQEYPCYRVIYINDHSTDKTLERVEHLVEKKLQLDTRLFNRIDFDDEGFEDIPETTRAFSEKIGNDPCFFTLVNNKNRCGALANLYRAIQSCKNEEIIVVVDGDDWLMHHQVLQDLNAAYQNPKVWMTHGNLEEYPRPVVGWCLPIPEVIIQDNAFREFRCPTHLKTFYAGLFKKIDLEDLLYEGKFFAMTSDMAIMYPMIEMAAERHIFIWRPNYVYNMSNPINDNKLNPGLQNLLDEYIRNGKRYDRLEKTPFDESSLEEKELECLAVEDV